MTPSPIGVRLREVRERAKVSASGLSLAAGARSRDVVRQIETGEIQDPSAKLVLGLADALGISVEWLMSGNGEAPSSEELDGAADRVRVSQKKTGTEG